MLSNIEITIQKMCIPYNGKEKGHQYDSETLFFENMTEFNKWLKDTYGTHKRVKQYIDTKDNETIGCGYVISFRNYQFDDSNKKYHFIEQHWITVYKRQIVELGACK